MSETTVRQPSLKELAARCLANNVARSPSANASPRECEKTTSLTRDLERRVRMMAQRWQYTGAELAEVLCLARSDPAAWLQAVTIDERREHEFRERGYIAD